MLKSNITGRKLKLRLVGDAVNTTTGEVGDELLSTNFLKPALHGFFPWSIGKNTVAKNADYGLVRLRFQRYFVDEDGEEERIDHDLQGPTIRTVPARRHETGAEHGGIPAGAELYIALPSVFGALGLVMVLGLIWSRSRRRARFDLGSRAVPAGTKSQRSARLGRAQRMLNRMKKKKRSADQDGHDEQGVQLLDRDLRAYDEDDEDEGGFAGQEGWGPAPTQRRQSKEGYKES
jgi:Psg1-like protein